MFIMNYNKHIKPNLLEPIISKKIIRTLNPPKEDYWEPTKNTMTQFYHNYIFPNILLILFIIFVLILLFYRYRITKKEREDKPQENFKSELPIINQENSSKISETMYMYPNAQTLFDTYNFQKEEAREPQIKKFSTRVNPAPRFAYPLYPYTKGGKLSPSSSKK